MVKIDAYGEKHPTTCSLPGSHIKTACLAVRSFLETLAQKIEQDTPAVAQYVREQSKVFLDSGTPDLTKPTVVDGKRIAKFTAQDARGNEHNFVIISKHDCDSSKSLFLPSDEVWYMKEGSDVYDLLVQAKIFPSKGQARKANVVEPIIPSGWSEIGPIGKRNHMLFVYNPQHGPDCPCNENNFVEQAIREVDNKIP